MVLNQKTMSTLYPRKSEEWDYVWLYLYDMHKYVFNNKQTWHIDSIIIIILGCKESKSSVNFTGDFFYFVFFFAP